MLSTLMLFFPYFVQILLASTHHSACNLILPPTHTHSLSLSHTHTDMKHDNVKLKEENSALRAYIDHLVLTVMDTRPELLEVQPTPAAPLTQSSSSLLST